MMTFFNNYPTHIQFMNILVSKAVSHKNGQSHMEPPIYSVNYATSVIAAALIGFSRHYSYSSVSPAVVLSKVILISC